MSQPDIAGLPGVHASANIQEHPDAYEIENEAADPELRLEAAMWAIAPWEGKVVLDLGAGTGFHLPRFHDGAAHVIAVEPHGPSRLRAMERVARLGLERVSVMTGSAERLPLATHSVDIVHARFAYFFPPKIDPGLAELERTIRPGGAAFIIDNDYREGIFASWLARSRWCKHLPPDELEAFWASHRFSMTPVRSEWRFRNRADLEAVIAIEFPPELVPAILRDQQGTTVDYAYRLYHRTYL